MHTTAYWLTVPVRAMAALPFASDDRRDGIVGLSFAMRQVAQLLLMCDRQDIGISIGSGNEHDSPDLTRAGEPVTLSDEPRIFIYDNYPGGIGFSEPLFAMDARASTPYARPDCRLRVPAGMSGVRGSDRQHRSAGKDRGAADSGFDWRPALERGA